MEESFPYRVPSTLSEAAARYAEFEGAIAVGRANGTLTEEWEARLLDVMERLWRDMTLEEQRRVIEREAVGDQDLPVIPDREMVPGSGELPRAT